MGPTKKLLHSDCLVRTGVHTGTTVHTGIVINYRLAIGHTYGLTRTLLYTTLTAITLFLIHFSRHSSNPFKKLHIHQFITRSTTTQKAQKDKSYKIIMILQHKFSGIRIKTAPEDNKTTKKHFDTFEKLR